jgi:elongation factor P
LPEASQIESGKILVIDGELWKVLGVRRLGTAGDSARAASLRTTLRSLTTRALKERSFRATDRVAFALVGTRELQYLYAEGPLHHFMDTVTYEQCALDAELLGDSLQFIQEGDTVSVEMLDERPVGVVLPPVVPLVVTATGPGTPGDTVPNVFKDATLETGLRIRVPLSVEMGETVRVDTRTGQFVERVS